MANLMQHAPRVVRTLLGLALFVFGLNGFLGFLPAPPVSEQGGAFLGALAATGYMFPLIKATETLAGALLLGNRFVPLALTVVAPVLVNILAFHSLLSPAGTGLAVLLVSAELFLAYTYRESFRPVLAARVQPVSPGQAAPRARHAHA